jgi:hypothetical protein
MKPILSPGMVFELVSSRACPLLPVRVNRVGAGIMGPFLLLHGVIVVVMT